MNISTDLRASINKKVKLQKGQKISINDIMWNQRPGHHKNPNSLIEINPNILNENSLYKATFDNMVQEMKKSRVLQTFNLSDPMISFIYSRDWKDSFDLVINFFCKINGTADFLFLEADLNTASLEFSKMKPNIYFISCYKIVDEYPNPDFLLPVANSALALKGIKGYSAVNVKLARSLFVNELINPESFTLDCVLIDSNKNHHNAILAYTIEDETHKASLAFFELLPKQQDFQEEKKNVPMETEIKQQKIELLLNNVNDVDIFKAAPENSFEIFNPNMLSKSKHLKSALNYLETEKVLADRKYKDKIENLLSGVSMKNENGVISLICDFSYVVAEDKVSVMEVNLTCWRKQLTSGEEEELKFAVIKIEKVFMSEIKLEIGKKSLPSHTDVQKALATLINEHKEYNYIKHSVVCDIITVHYLYNDNLIFPEHYGVKFTYMSNNSRLLTGFIIYCIHDFDKSLIPVCYFDLDDKGNFIEKDNNIDELILDIRLIQDAKDNTYNIVQIPASLNYQMHSYLEKYNQLIKSSIIAKHKLLTIDSNLLPFLMYSQLRQFNDCSHDLVSYVYMKLENKEYIVSEITFKVFDLYSFNKNNSELKSIKSFLLSEISQASYPDYCFILSLLWVNTVNHLNNGIEILKVKTSNYLENSYFTRIYYVEYQTLVNTSSYSFFYGITKHEEALIISPIFAIPNIVNIKNHYYY